VYELAVSGISAGGSITVSATKDGYTVNPASRNVTVFYSLAGKKTAYSGGAGEPSFNMVSVPGDVTFPTGTSDSGNVTVSGAYEIGETQVTYELWYGVRVWAESNGYTFYNNPGREGSSGTTENTTPGANKQEPVTMVTWFDAVVWLNALTEWYNAKNPGSTPLTAVYYYDSGYTGVAKNSDYNSNFVKEDGSYSYASAYTKPGTTGFRLPASNEWELAARWRGNDSANTVSGYTNPYFTKGDSASGATASYSDTAATNAVGWYYYSTDFPGGTQKTQPVKGKAANALGLYDMSGNVWEWSEDWHPSYYRILRGGSWDYYADYLRVGIVSYSPDYRGLNIGFRPVRTAN
jgi:formylglycine-generating enzyme required for sulfatase activity